jgi:hypothetical protein
MSMSIGSVDMPRFSGERGRMLDFRGSSSRTLLLPQHFVADCGKCSASVLL